MTAVTALLLESKHAVRPTTTTTTVARPWCTVQVDRDYGPEDCGKPAVDFVQVSEGRLYYCAEHWDDRDAVLTQPSL